MVIQRCLTRHPLMPGFMQPEKSPSSSDKFLAVACDQSLLNTEDARTLHHFAKSHSLGSSEAALQTGMLKPIEVEIVEAFTSPGDLAPGYELKDVLGHGALGIVFRAHQSRLQRDVAIKSIIESRIALQNVIARFEQEGKAIGRLKHPNIVRAYDSGCHNDRLYLVMELVEGKDLRKKLESGALDSQTSLWILRQTALGLAHARSHDIIHRDIKPGNLLLTNAPAGFDLPSGIPLVKIADFGLAQLNTTEDSDLDQSQLTIAGTTIGTPMYSAPEQLSGDPIDHRVDLYALGATLFHMLSGETPFAAGKLTKIFSAKANGTPPRMELIPKTVDPAIVDLMLDLMDPDPAKRVADYTDLVARIDHILHPGSADPQGPNASLGRTNATDPKGVRRAFDVRDWFSKHLNSVRLVSMIILAAVLCGVVISQPRLLRIAATPSLVPDGWEEALFDGRTLNGYKSPDGLWLATNDAEGGSVLMGEGSILRPLPIPPIPNPDGSFGFGFRVGIDLTTAEQCEVHFGFRNSSLSDCERYIVRYNRESVSFGTGSGPNGEYSIVSREIALFEDDTEVPTYAQVKIELHNAQWFVFFNGELLGDAAVIQEGNNTILEFLTRRGKANFESPSIYRLSQQKTPPQ